MKTLLPLITTLVLSLLNRAVLDSQPAPRVVGLSSAEAISDQRFGLILNIRELPDGQLLVNDGQRHQLSILDAKLKNRVLAIDSVFNGSQSYGRNAAAIIPYLFDSTLFVDLESQTFLVLDPKGKIAHVMAPANTADMAFLNMHLSGIDSHGNLIYQGTSLSRKKSLVGPRISSFDSLPIVRANAETRAIDTLAIFAVATGLHAKVVRDGAKEVTTLTLSPISNVDDWVVLSDGTLLIIRGHDYHAEWLTPRGEWHVGSKLAFDWKRISEGEKQRLVDSANTALSQKAATRSPQGSKYPPGFEVPGGGIVVMSCNTAECAGAVRHFFVEEVAPLAEIPDYWPPIRRNAVKPDLDNHAWVLPTTSAQSTNGELVYDVIDNMGVLSKRVRIPEGRSIAGFGRNGTVYLMYRDNKGWAVEKARVMDTK